MALINRMSRLFTADVHAVLDRIEEPDVLLRHAVREMEDEVVRSEQHVKQLGHERDRLADRHRKVQAALAELDEQISIAFHASNDELARLPLTQRQAREPALDFARQLGDVHVARRQHQHRVLVVAQREQHVLERHLGVSVAARIIARPRQGGREPG